MRLVDRYILSHFSRPMLVGVAAFTAIIMGVGQLYELVELMVRKGVPVGTALEAFALRTPTTVALTMPMATLFAALMSSGELSSHGEVVAMRAGGISIGRMAYPVLFAGLLVTLCAFGFNELLGPACNHRATTLILDFVRQSGDFEREVALRMPEKGQTERRVLADKFSVRDKRMTNVIIIEYDKGKPRDVYFAEQAQWRGETWFLLNVLHKRDTGAGYQEDSLQELRYNLGKTPEEIQVSAKPRPEDMALSQLLEEVRQTPPEQLLYHRGTDTRPLRLLQHFHLRIATPWAALTFALLGFPLGMRPQRTSTGIGFGLSLVVVFVYYIIVNVLRAFGEQGALSPLLAAWIPNLMVVGVGLGLMLDAGR